MSLNIVNSFNITPPPDTVGGWVEIGRTTLGSPSSTLGVNGLADKRYYMMLINDLGRSAAITDDAWQPSQLSTFETGANMANRSNRDGGSEVTQINTATPTIGTLSDVTPRFLVGYWANVPTKEKLLSHHVCGGSASGVGTAPPRNETIGKWAQTTNPLDGMRITTTNANTYNTGSEIVFLEWDPADVRTDNFWEELASVQASGSSSTLSTGAFTAKKYLWIQYYAASTSTVFTTCNFNNDSSALYSYRLSSDGGSEQVTTGDTAFFPVLNAPNGHFVNMFIVNNLANEKLAIINSVNQNTAGAATAPGRREMVLKYVETSAQITQLDIGISTGNFGANSIVKVWGSD